MVRFSHAIALGLAFFMSACGRSSAPPPESANAISPEEQLSRIVERYWEARVPHGTPLSAQYLADVLANERTQLEAAVALRRDRLNASSQLTYDIFVSRRRRNVEGFTFPAELVPIEPFNSLPLELAREAAKAGEAQVATAKDYDRWLKRLDDAVVWMRQAMANMRDGARRGYTVPRVLIERMLPLIEPLGEDTPTNVFYMALHDDRSTSGARLTGEVRDKLLPAYRELHTFLKNDYLPKARSTVSLSALPLGTSWYAHQVANAGGGRLDPGEIHAQGLAEVERLRARVQALPVGGVPNVGSDPILAAEELKSKVLVAAPNLFSILPKEDFTIRAFTPRFDEPSMIYQAAAPPAHPSAVLYVAAGSTEGRVQAIDVSDFVEAALPGRHFQSALQEERTDLPAFRRFETDPAFVEGWALYAASLGEELGVYDEEAKRGALLRQLRCAVGSVVDTGVHAKGWTRSQAVEYFRTQAEMDDIGARAAADRIIALPGSALSCALGQQKFHALRSVAQQALGARFDLKEFHAQILREGSMPLDILEARMRAWMGMAR